MKTIATLVLTATTCVACASTPVPADKYARARGAIQTAETMNVERMPNAATHLTLARQELDHAKDLLSKGENEQAGYVLLKAEADAEAAVSLAREVWAKQEAAQTIERVNQLQAQMQMQQQQMEGQ